jgi:E3 ubiquitin-protein ligase HUWE1
LKFINCFWFRHTLELFISLAKSFPGYFVPIKSKEAEDKDKDKDKEKDKDKDLSIGKEETGAKPKTASKPGKSDAPDFWDMLLRLDTCASKKGKSVARTHSNTNLGGEPEQSVLSFEASSFGQLISMLNWSVIKRSSQLTDKLLRLLSLISIGLTEVHPNRRQEGGVPKTKKPTEVNKDWSIAAPESHIKLAVQVLTSKSCSEEGLEDATALLLNLSHCPDPTRQLVSFLRSRSSITLRANKQKNLATIPRRILNEDFKRGF